MEFEWYRRVDVNKKFNCYCINLNKGGFSPPEVFNESISTVILMIRMLMSAFFKKEKQVVAPAFNVGL
jgi:hypothetical protein